MSGLEGKVAIVTGAARGIGAAIAKKLADVGAKVVIADLLTDEAIQIQESIVRAGGHALVVTFDVSVRSEVENLVSTTLQHFGAVDILVNNAAILVRGAFIDLSEQAWDTAMNVNLKGPFLLSQAAARVMKEQGRGGKIINIGSIDGVAVYRFSPHAAYGVSKAGLTMLSKVMANELAPYKICVNTVCPGVVQTDISAGSLENPTHRDNLLGNIPLRRFGGTNEVADLVAFLAGAEADYITGALMCVDGGWTI